MPLRYRPMVGSWLRRHLPPRWRVVLWNRRHAEDLVESRFPELVQIYRGFPRPVQRADLLRYLLLYEYGGFYADLDVLCVRGLARMLEECQGAHMLVQVETVLSPQRAAEIGQTRAIREGRPEIEERIANYFLAGQAGPGQRPAHRQGRCRHRLSGPARGRGPHPQLRAHPAGLPHPRRGPA